jgi:hypothetical protein
LQPTDQFLPHCFCRPLTIIKKAAVTQKEWWERSECWLFFSFLLTFFQWNCYF